MTPGYRAGLFLLSMLGIAVAWGASRGVLLPFSKSHCELGIPCSNGDITAVENIFCCRGPHCPGCSNRLWSPLLCSARASWPSLLVPPLPPRAVTALGREGTGGRDRPCCSKRMCIAKHSLPGQTVGLLVLSALSLGLRGAQGAASRVCPAGNL